MRFDDTLDTVLSIDLSGETARASAWRQLVDLLGRGRVGADDRAIAALTALRDSVPLPVRIASARALEFASPPAALVEFMAADVFDVALPLLRGATLDPDQWTALLPRLGPPARGVLRNRRDLDPKVRRALESFGSVDLALRDESPPSCVAEATGSTAVPVMEVASPAPFAKPGIRHDPLPEFSSPPADAPVQDEAAGTFSIVDVMARIEAFERVHEPAVFAVPAPAPIDDRFQFETDATGTVRWVEGVARAPLIGLSLAKSSRHCTARTDGIFAGALRRRAAFQNARLHIAGTSDAGGDWQLSAVPMFDHASGRFTGFRGTGRRPRSDERAEPRRPDAGIADLRQLVHELRTPAGAIAGFAEIIEAQLFGPVPAVYRDRAGTILDHSRELVAVIDDLDLAARIDGNALDLRADQVALAPLFATIERDLASLCELRGIELEIETCDIAAVGDRRAVERLLARLLATLASAGGPGETLYVRMGAEHDGTVAIVFDRPTAFDAWPGESIFDVDDGDEDGTLLGTGFALRLARNLARELGGALVFGTATLTLRLTGVADALVEEASAR